MFEKCLFIFNACNSGSTYVSVSPFIGVIGMEGKLIRRNAISMFIYSIAIAVFFAILIYTGLNPFPL